MEEATHDRSAERCGAKLCDKAGAAWPATPAQRCTPRLFLQSSLLPHSCLLNLRRLLGTQLLDLGWQGLLIPALDRGQVLLSCPLLQRWAGHPRCRANRE